MNRLEFSEWTRNKRKQDLNNKTIADQVIEQFHSQLNTNVTEYIKNCFLKMIESYDKRERKFAMESLHAIYTDALQSSGGATSSDKALSLLDKVYEYDYDLHNSSAQAKRSARGYFLERVLESLFVHTAGDRYMRQVKIVHGEHEKKIDFVVGANQMTPDDDNFLYVTAKKSLRERGPQVSDEKRFLDTKILYFFYADIKCLSDSILSKFYSEDIVLVTYSDCVRRHYPDNKNVISYDKFFLELLPAYLNNRQGFQATEFGIETQSQKAQP